MKKKMFLLLGLVPLLSGCLYTQSVTAYVLTAEQLPTSYDINPNTLTDSGHTFTYVSVYGDSDGNFVFHYGGYFESTNGIPANSLTLTYNSNFQVYGITNVIGSDTVVVELFDTFDTEYNKDSEITGYSYNLTGYDNFRIVNNSSDGENDNVLGIMTFWS